MNPSGEQQLPPSIAAARRAGPRPPGRRTASRSYPRAVVDTDAEALTVRLAATRALLVARSPEDVAGIIATLVRDLGGGLLPARLADDATALPLDVSLGLTEPMLPWADPVSIAAMRIATVVPAFLEDARAVVGALQAKDRLPGEDAGSRPQP